MRRFRLFSYNEKTMEIKNVTNRVILCFLILLGVTNFISFSISKKYDVIEQINQISAEEKLILINSVDTFSETKLLTYLKELNVKYPHIIYAQSKLETGNFTSKIFRENNNLFGMKQAVTRATTNKGTQYGHAYFDTWRESVIDYAIYQSRYLSSLKTEDSYYDYLSRNYAEDTNYVSKLRKMIRDEELKEKISQIALN